MNIEFDTLECVNFLLKKGVARSHADAFVLSLRQCEITNLSSKEEVNAMITQQCENLFDRIDRESKQRAEQFEKQLVERRQEFNRQMDERRKVVETQFSELRTSFRWVCGVIITCTLGLGGYISILLHYLH